MKDIKTAEEVKNAIESILISETLSIKIKTNTLVSLFNSQLKAKVESVSDEEIAVKINSDENLAPYYGSCFRIIKWFKNKLLNDL